MANLKYKSNETQLTYTISIECDYFWRIFLAWADCHGVSPTTQKTIVKNLNPFLRQNCANLRAQQLKRAILYVSNASASRIEEVCDLFNSAIKISVNPLEKS